MTRVETVTKSFWYPTPAPYLIDEKSFEYSDRVTGADGTYQRPYNHLRGRECSLGFHTSCASNAPGGGPCECPHHFEPLPNNPMHVGAEKLASMYDLPNGTADRVMRVSAHALGGFLHRVTRFNQETVSAALYNAYGETAGKDFVNDVISLFREFGFGDVKEASVGSEVEWTVKVLLECGQEDGDDERLGARIEAGCDWVNMARGAIVESKRAVAVYGMVRADTAGDAVTIAGDSIRAALDTDRAGIYDVHARRV